MQVCVDPFLGACQSAAHTSDTCPPPPNTHTLGLAAFLPHHLKPPIWLFF